MPNQGKLIIGLIVLTAITAASVAWWFTYQKGQRVLGLWGSESAYRIRLAPECELVELGPVEALGTDVLVINDRSWRSVRQRALDNAPGFVHARQALIDDQSYGWNTATVNPGDNQWQYALRFRDERGETLLLFDFVNNEVLEPTQHRRVNIAPIASGLQAYFREQLSAVSGQPADGSTAVRG